MAKILGTAVAFPVVQSDDRSTRPTHEASRGKGGLRTVTSTAQRDAIPTEQREAGMIVKVSAGGSIVGYELGQDLVSWTVSDVAPGADIYPTTTAGLAAVAEGEYFFVPGATGLQLYRDLSGVATAVGDFPLFSELSSQATASAASASASAESAETSAESAATYSDQARAAADATSPTQFYDTKALAVAALASIAANEVIQVWIDETQSNYRTTYKKESGVLVLKATFQADLIRSDLASTAAGLGADLVALAQGGTVQDAVKWKTPEMYEDASGTAISVNASPAIQAMFNAAVSGDHFHFEKLYKCLSKITIGAVAPAELLGLVISGTRSSYVTGVNTPRVYLDPASADSVLFEMSQAPGALFKDIALVGKGVGVAGSYVFTATEENADVDITFENCALSGAETAGKVSGRGLAFLGGSISSVVHGFELAWPDPFTPGANTDQSIGSAMRSYRVCGARLHAWSGGHVIRNVGPQAHRIRSVEVSGNYCDTQLRMWDGHIVDSVVKDNVVLNAVSTAGLPLFNIPSDLNAFGGVINKNVEITDNYFGGQLDATYASGTDVVDNALGQGVTVANISGLLVKNNIFNRVARDVLNISASSSVKVVGNLFRDVCLDAARTLTVTGATGVFLAGETITGGTSGHTGVNAYVAKVTLRLNNPTGAFTVTETVTGGTSGVTATVGATALTDRYPVRLTGTIDDIEVSGNTIRTAHKTTNVIPIVGEIASITLTNSLYKDNYVQTGYWLNPTDKVSRFFSISDDAVAKVRLPNIDGVVTIVAVTAATNEPAVIAYKITGTDALAIVSDPAAVYALSSGVLTGTTGTDAKINISFVEENSGLVMYIENRRGSTRSVIVPGSYSAT